MKVSLCSSIQLGRMTESQDLDGFVGFSQHNSLHLSLNGDLNFVDRFVEGGVQLENPFEPLENPFRTIKQQSLGVEASRKSSERVDKVCSSGAYSVPYSALLESVPPLWERRQQKTQQLPLPSDARYPDLWDIILYASQTSSFGDDTTTLLSDTANISNIGTYPSARVSYKIEELLSPVEHMTSSCLLGNTHSMHLPVPKGASRSLTSNDGHQYRINDLQSPTSRFLDGRETQKNKRQTRHKKRCEPWKKSKDSATARDVTGKLFTTVVRDTKSFHGPDAFAQFLIINADFSTGLINKICIPAEPGTASRPIRAEPIRHVCPRPGCGQTFSRHGHVWRHSRIHENLDPYKCPHHACHAAYSRLDNCTHHQKRHHHKILPAHR